MTTPDLKQLKREFLDNRVNAYSGAVLDAAAHMLFELGDSKRLIRVASRFVAEKLDACRADIGLGSRFDKTYQANAEWLKDECEPPSMMGVVLPNQDKAIQSVWRSSLPVAYNDCYNQPELAPLKEGFVATRLRSLVAQKLVFAGNSFGILCVDQTTHARAWKPGDHEFIREFTSDFISPLLHISIQLEESNKPSPKELDAIRLAASGLSYKQIAARLNKSVRTVEHQLRNARRKMGAANQADLIQKCQAWL